MTRNRAIAFYLIVFAGMLISIAWVVHRNNEELRERGVWIKNMKQWRIDLERRTDDRYYKTEFEEFLKANPQLKRGNQIDHRTERLIDGTGK